jgi:threonine/homoserine/homoserine lactone efflux protein
LVGQFAALYFVICYLSIACWAYAGAFLRQYLEDSRRMRRFNRSLALLLVLSALYLLWP